MNNKKNIKQRALILQGGGTLGAYEVGVVNVLYHWIRKDCNENDNIFDIIAGTSIGAINAAIITSHTKDRRKNDRNLSIKDSWIGVTDKLLSFWKDISSSTLLEWNPFYEAMWDTSHFMADTFLKNTIDWSGLIAHSNPFFSGIIKEGIDILKTYYQIPATGETARRFYSVKQFLLLGAKNVFTPSIPKLDTKFYYNIPTLPNNIWYNYDNSMLERTLTEYVTFPISTSYYSDNYNDDDVVKDKISKRDDNISKETNTRHILNEPRLLVVSVDIQAGATVSFDSYEYSARKCPICPSKDEDKDEKDNNIPTENELIEHVKEKHLDFVKMDGLKHLRLSTYDDHKIDSDHNDEEKHIIFYNEGIKSEHVMASASIPIFYNYRKLVANKYDSQGELLGKQERYFWDGQLLSNTPLRELINGHTLYWRDKIGYQSLLDEILQFSISKDDNNNQHKNDNKVDPIELSLVPDLEVYIANIWPSKENEIPTDHDLTMDRKNDIGNHDKTIYDEKTSELVTDYIDLCKKLITSLSTNGNSKKIINNILKDKATSTLRNGKKRKNEDLLVGKFEINKVIRIERKDDPYSISEKWADLSKKTIDKLIKQGIEDTVRTLLTETVISLDSEYIRDVNKEKLFEIVNDVEHHVPEKRNIIYRNFLSELEKNGYDKIKLEKRYDSTIKSIDALIEGLELYHSK
jgi:NTE family protein